MVAAMALVGLLASVGLAGCASQGSSATALPKLTSGGAAPVLVVTDRRGSGAYDHVSVTAGRPIAVSFACSGGGGAEVALASAPNAWTYDELACTASSVQLAGPRALTSMLELRVRVAPSEHWSAVVSQ